MTITRLPSQPNSQVHLPRVADVVADRIRERIIAGELTEGERLPRFDHLLEEFGVSGPSMREALRILESEGLVTVRRGSMGGAIVHRPSHESAAYTLALILRSQGTSLVDLRVAMAQCERVCASLCAQRPDRQETVQPELEILNAQALAQIDDPIRFGSAMANFHAALVLQCGNQTFNLVAGSLESIFLSQLWGDPIAENDMIAHSTRKSRLTELASHEEIAEAIASGDANKVDELMVRHSNVGRYMPAEFRMRKIHATPPRRHE